jgi:hypothetical protein
MFNRVVDKPKSLDHVEIVRHYRGERVRLLLWLTENDLIGSEVRARMLPRSAPLCLFGEPDMVRGF